ncbi:MAG TPA: TrkA family potassium uptake protein [Micromonosporaceae bacterium]|nr:TrkA family potassium uptake protein [Micromonosporaceae bacterium]
MRAIVIGCGRVGSALAARLAVDGHDVRVVDRNPKARRLLPKNFPGRYLTGNGYSRDTLLAAGVEQADAFIAVTSGDNSNIVAARTAREEYRVPIVIARIYDPRRADIYRELGIPTVASVRWTVERIHQMLAHRHLTPEQSFGNGETLLVRSQLPTYLAGRPLADLDLDGEIRVVEVTRGGRSLIPAHGATAEPDDLVTFTVAAAALGRLRVFLDRELGT